MNKTNEQVGFSVTVRQHLLLLLEAQRLGGFAREIGLPESTLRLYARGVRESMPVGHFEKILLALSDHGGEKKKAGVR